MKKKIIQVLCHTLNQEDNLQYHVLGNWAGRQARLINKYSNQYVNEVWYAIKNTNKKKVFIENGITYKLFPATSLNGLLESWYGIIHAPSLLKELEQENPHQTIINFQGERGSLIHAIMSAFPQFYYSLQYHGYGQPSWLDWTERILITPIEKKNFPLVRHFFIHIKRRIEYLTNQIGIPQNKMSFQSFGVDYDLFKPHNKNKTRDVLKLPQDAYILLYVGRMTQSKGVDKLIDAYKILKKRHPQLYLLLIGASKEDPLYKQARAHADYIIETISNDTLPFFYTSADAYCFFGNKKTIEYAGIGTAPSEALACNVNVISTNLIHLPKHIIPRAGIVPKNFEHFVECIEYLITNPKKQFNARKLVAPYISNEIKTKHMLTIYEHFFQMNTDK